MPSFRSRCSAIWAMNLTSSTWHSTATGKKRDYIKALKRINPKMSIPKITKAIADAIKRWRNILMRPKSIYYQNLRL